MIGGVTGKIIRVDLTNKTYSIGKLDEQLYQHFLGSRGLGSKLFYDEVLPGIDPFSKENKIFIMTGLLNGTRVPATPKHTWITKSPANGFYAEGSTSGGKFAIYLKQNGFDGLIIEGVSADKVYLVINKGKVEFHSANQLWGLTVSEAERALKDRYNQIQAAIIGPGGENLVYYAAVRVERRTVGRTGIGSVMGSKNLKAVGVLPGDYRLEIKNEKEYQKLVRQFYQAINREEFTSKTRRLYGTTHMFDMINENGVMPTYNFKESKFEKDTIDFSHLTIREKYTIRDDACYRCPVVCGKKMLAKNGQYAGSSSSGPEWETMWAFGPQCGNNNFESIIRANELCNELGIDTISTGNAIGFAMECYEKGLITDQDLGYSLDWGDHEAVIRLIHDIAFKQNFGKELSLGTKVVAKKFGVEDIAMQVKGIELPAYDPRSVWGMGLAYATSSRGGCHLRSFTPGAELGGLGGGRYSIEGKAEFIVNDQNIRGVFESSGQCFTATAAIDTVFYARLLSAVTGLKFAEEDLYTIGERIYNVERLLAVREGIKKESDTLPGRIFKEEISNGPAKGQKIPYGQFLKMLEEYYKLRGWSPESGVPEESKLKGLKII